MASPILLKKYERAIYQSDTVYKTIVGLSDKITIDKNPARNEFNITFKNGLKICVWIPIESFYNDDSNVGIKTKLGEASDEFPDLGYSARKDCEFENVDAFKLEVQRLVQVCN